jgi:hypothetical protein
MSREKFICGFTCGRAEREAKRRKMFYPIFQKAGFKGRKSAFSAFFPQGEG